MNINLLASRIAVREKGKKEINIAQIKEVLRIINDITGGKFYKLIRGTA